jgi:DNA-binding transcriptional LysR family regulator
MTGLRPTHTSWRPSGDVLLSERDLDLRAVRCLVVLADAGNYALAAGQLHMSQPGLTRKVMALEARLGFALVMHDRGRRLQLTSRGRIVVEYGRQLLDLQQRALEVTSEADLRHSEAS